MSSDVIDSHRVRALLIEGGSGRIFDRRMPRELYLASQQPNGHGASIFFDDIPSPVRIYSYIPSNVVRNDEGYFGSTDKLTDEIVDYVKFTYHVERSFRRAGATAIDTYDHRVKPVPAQFPTLETTVLQDTGAHNFLNGLSLFLYVHESQEFADLLRDFQGDEQKFGAAKVRLSELIVKAHDEGCVPFPF